MEIEGEEKNPTEMKLFLAKALDIMNVLRKL